MTGDSCRNPPFGPFDAHHAERKFFPAHQPSIDAPLVIAVDQHHMTGWCAAERGQNFAVENGQHRAVLGFDNSQKISTKVDHHTRGIAHGMFVDRLIKQFQRSQRVRVALD